MPEYKFVHKISTEKQIAILIALMLDGKINPENNFKETCKTLNHFGVDWKILQTPFLIGRLTKEYFEYSKLVILEFEALGCNRTEI